MDKVLRSIICCALLLQGIVAFAADPPIPPKSNRLVNDYAGVLAAGNLSTLERKLVAYDDSTSTQIAIVIEQYLESGAVFDRSVEIAQSWGVGGRANEDNGILIYIAVENRKIFIQNGYGIESRLTDAFTKRIIDQVIVPNFRAGRYYRGLDEATSVMIQIMAGAYSAVEEESSTISPLMMLLIFFIAFVLLTWLISKGGGNDDDDGGYYRGGRYRGPTRSRGGWVITPGGGFGGGGFGGGGIGGGGFGGFGGGGFGGGGAGGSW